MESLALLKVLHPVLCRNTGAIMDDRIFDGVVSCSRQFCIAETFSNFTQTVPALDGLREIDESILQYRFNLLVIGKPILDDIVESSE